LNNHFQLYLVLSLTFISLPLLSFLINLSILSSIAPFFS